MRKSLSAVLVTFILALASAALLAGETIAGVGVKLGKNPGGSIVATGTTDKNGMVVFENVKIGKYLITVTPQARAIVSTTRSNIKHSSEITASGVQEEIVSITMGPGAADAKPIEIDIQAQQGKITVTVTREAAAPQRRVPVRGSL